MAVDEHNPKGWTFASFADYVEKQFVCLADSAKAAMNAAEKATLKAEAASDKRFESVNEFRAAMNDQQNKFADKEQSDFRLTSLDKRIGEMEIKVSASVGKGQGVWLLAVIIGQGLLIAIGLAAFFKQ